MIRFFFFGLFRFLFYIYLNIERFFYSSTFGFSYDLNTRSEHLQLNCDDGRPSQPTADIKKQMLLLTELLQPQMKSITPKPKQKQQEKHSMLT